MWIEKITVLEQGGNAEILNQFRSHRNLENTWRSVLADSVAGVAAVEEAAQELGVADLGLSADSVEAKASKALRDAHRELQDVVEGFQRAVLSAVEEAQLQLHKVRDGANATAWQEATKASDEAFQQVSLELAEAGISNPDEYRYLLQTATNLKRNISTLEETDKVATKKEEDAETALRRFRKLRTEHGKSREGFAKKASSDLIQVVIDVNGDRQASKEFLRKALSIDHFEEDHRQLAERLTSGVGGAWCFDQLDQEVENLRRLLTDPEMERDAADLRFVRKLRDLHPERLDRLALYQPEDAVKVSFTDPRDPKRSSRDLAQGSPGQQTAALLAFVLGYGSEPILLDQPEDDLDSILIYDLLVQRLREQKKSRQIIVVTHNPNIVVHGDAELVISLEAKSGQTHPAFVGGLQEQQGRDEICRVMEGGREAFETRYRRIMTHRGTADGRAD